MHSNRRNLNNDKTIAYHSTNKKLARHPVLIMLQLQLPLPAPTLGILRRAVDQHKVFCLNGPAGSGKLSAVHQALADTHEVVTLDITDVALAEQPRFEAWVKRHIGGGSFSDRPVVKVLASADLLNADKLNFLLTYLQLHQNVRVVVLANTKLPGRLPIVYHKPCPWQFKHQLALHYGCEPGHVQQVLEEAGTDLRQIALRAGLGASASRTDPLKHLYFNISDLFHGKRVPEDLLCYGPADRWIHKNYMNNLPDTFDLEKLASHASNMAMLDHSFGDDPLGINLQIMQGSVAVNGLRRSGRMQLQHPYAVLGRPSRSETRAALDRFSAHMPAEDRLVTQGNQDQLGPGGDGNEDEPFGLNLF